MRRVTSLMLVALMALLFACRPPSDGAGRTQASSGADRSVTVELIGEPRVGDTQVKVTVQREAEPVSNAKVTVAGDMTHAGMASVIAEVEAQEDGTYLTNGFEFTMAGDWILTVDVTYPDGERVRRSKALTVRSQ